jgi:hypothetical protein
MNNSNNSSNNATGNSTGTPSNNPSDSTTSPPSNSTPFDSPAQRSQNLQNGIYRHSELAMGMGMNPPSFSVYPHNQMQHSMTGFPGLMPMHPMNIFSMNPTNNFNMYEVPSTSAGHHHQRSLSFPIAPGTQPYAFPVHPFNNGNGMSQGQNQTTVNPLDISSPTLDSAWQHDLLYLQSPPQHAPVGFQSPYLSDPRALPHGSGYPPLFASPETTLGPNAPGTAAGTSTSAGNTSNSNSQKGPTGSTTQANGNSGSKNTSDMSGSNDTSLKYV